VRRFADLSLESGRRFSREVVLMGRLVVGLVAAAVLSGAPPLLADKPEKSKGKSKSQGQDAALVVTFTADQRQSAQSYFVEKHGRGGCPPGLAKKNNGCLPPGQAKRRYAIGHALPRDLATERLPAELSVRIGPPPAGYAYVMLDGDVLKLAAGTMLVVDAITGLVD
jgi:hypothetical protein